MEMLEINSQPLLSLDPSLDFFLGDDLSQESSEDDIFLNTLDFSVFAATALGNILSEVAENFLYQDAGLPLPSPGLGLIEELELDEEIHSLEEEIARIEEQKRLLKMASLPGSPLASPVISIPTYEIKLDFLSESLEQLLPSSPTEEPEIKIEESIEESTDTTQYPPFQSKKEKQRKRKSPSVKTKKILSEDEVEIDPIITNRKKKAKTRKKSSLKVDLAEIFKLEEILKIKNVSQDEDEYVDIL